MHYRNEKDSREQKGNAFSDLSQTSYLSIPVLPTSSLDCTYFTLFCLVCVFLCLYFFLPLTYSVSSLSLSFFFPLFIFFLYFLFSFPLSLFSLLCFTNTPLLCPAHRFFFSLFYFYFFFFYFFFLRREEGSPRCQRSKRWIVFFSCVLDAKLYIQLLMLIPTFFT